MPRYFDNTRLSSYQNCPRFHYLRHVKGWKLQGGMADALAFGLGWHEAQDVLWGLAGKKPDEEVIKLACQTFDRKWQEEMGVNLDEIELEELSEYEPRSPGIAHEMIRNYYAQRADFIKGVEITSIERPFAVPLSVEDDSVMYVGRMDKVIKREGRIYGIEHKTTALYDKTKGFRNTFIEGFSPDSQVDGYLHALHMDYGNKAKAVWVDGALVHKQEHNTFKFIPIERNLAMLDSWREETSSWVSRILADEKKIEEDRQAGRVATSAFPKNTKSCFSYNKPCPFLDICRFKDAPHFEEEPPEGYAVEHWSPFDLLELERIGLEP